MPTLVNEVTDAHCLEFDGYVAKWQRILNLSDWRIERGFKRCKAMAEVTIDVDARLAVYRIGLSFGATEVTSDSLERTAVHELLHIVLHDAIKDPSDASEHAVVNMFEKLLMGANLA